MKITSLMQMVANNQCFAVECLRRSITAMDCAEYGHPSGLLLYSFQRRLGGHLYA